MFFFNWKPQKRNVEHLVEIQETLYSAKKYWIVPFSPIQLCRSSRGITFLKRDTSAPLNAL